VRVSSCRTPGPAPPVEDCCRFFRIVSRPRPPCVHEPARGHRQGHDSRFSGKPSAAHCLVAARSASCTASSQASNESGGVPACPGPAAPARAAGPRWPDVSSNSAALMTLADSIGCWTKATIFERSRSRARSQRRRSSSRQRFPWSANGTVGRDRMPFLMRTVLACFRRRALRC